MALFGGFKNVTTLGMKDKRTEILLPKCIKVFFIMK